MQELKQFTLNNVNNRLGHDVQEKVLPQYDSWGGCEGIAAKLGASLNAGIQASEVGARKEQYGINYIEPDPPTPNIKPTPPLVKVRVSDADLLAAAWRPLAMSAMRCLCEKRRRASFSVVAF